jgi:ABC-type phosphate/phosphonate transport system substrate-binding protein
MKFFIPDTKPADTQEAYQGIAKLLKEQLRMPITDRRIYSLSYTHDKRKWRAVVGEREEQEDRYDIVAIFEAKPYIVFTRAQNGGQGLTIMVNPDEITAIEYFDE